MDNITIVLFGECDVGTFISAAISLISAIISMGIARKQHKVSVYENKKKLLKDTLNYWENLCIKQPFDFIDTNKTKHFNIDKEELKLSVEKSFGKSVIEKYNKINEVYLTRADYDNKLSVLQDCIKDTENYDDFIKDLKEYYSHIDEIKESEEKALLQKYCITTTVNNELYNCDLYSDFTNYQSLTKKMRKAIDEFKSEAQKNIGKIN